MVSFEKPNFSFPFTLSQEIEHLRANKAHRGVPEKSSGRLLICTWNIANLGLHERTDDHYQMIAEVLSWFDIIALQEVHDDLTGLYQLEAHIGAEYDLIFSDRGGNDERSAYIFDASKVGRQPLIGELAIPPSEHRWIRLPGVSQKFVGFDRNPYIATFQFRNTIFMLLNAHLFFGSEAKEDMERRALEAFATGRYADLRRDDVHAFTENIIALGDFNIPKAEAGDPIFDALARRGLVVPEHSTRLGSSISTDAQYDQIAFFPSLKRSIKASGVFDYDRNIFPALWENGTRSDFEKYCRYYISDHRPMWMQVEFEE